MRKRNAPYAHKGPMGLRRTRATLGAACDLWAVSRECGRELHGRLYKCTSTAHPSRLGIDRCLGRVAPSPTHLSCVRQRPTLRSHSLRVQRIQPIHRPPWHLDRHVTTSTSQPLNLNNCHLLCSEGFFAASILKGLDTLIVN